MKKPKILLIQHGNFLSDFNLARLCQVLELINCQVEIFAGGNGRQSVAYLVQNPPDLLIFDHSMSLASFPLAGPQQLRDGYFGCPHLVLSEEQGLMKTAGQNVLEQDFPVDVIALHERIGQCLAHYPRKHLRMPAQLPCVFSARGFHSFGEILNLGTGGAFIKGFCHHLRSGDFVDVCIPLLGMKRELEMRSRLVYILSPGQENNFLQGLGIEFVSLDRETTRVLEEFLRLSLLDEISPVFSCFGLPGPHVTASNGSTASLVELNSRLHNRSQDLSSLGCLASRKT